MIKEYLYIYKGILNINLKAVYVFYFICAIMNEKI